MFSPICVPSISFSCPITVAKTQSSVLNKRKESQTLSAMSCSEFSVTATEGKLRPSPSHCSLPTDKPPYIPLPHPNKLQRGLAELCGSSSPWQPPSSNNIWCINFGSDFLFTFLFFIYYLISLGDFPFLPTFLLCICFPFIPFFNRVLLYSSDHSDPAVLNLTNVGITSTHYHTWLLFYFSFFFF